MPAELPMPIDDITVERLIRIESKIDRMCVAIDGDPADESKPGMRIRLDRLEQTGRLRTKVTAFLSAIVVVLFGEAARRWFGGAK